MKAVLLSFIVVGCFANAEIPNDSVTTPKLNSTGIGVNRILITDSMTGNTVTFATCGEGDVLVYTNFGWTCTSLFNSISKLQKKVDELERRLSSN